MDQTYSPIQVAQLSGSLGTKRRDFPESTSMAPQQSGSVTPKAQWKKDSCRVKTFNQSISHGKYHQDYRQDLKVLYLCRLYLSEKDISICAVPLLLLSPLKQHHGLWHHSIFGFQPYAQSLTVLCKEGSRHPQSVIAQPVNGSKKASKKN